MNYEGPVKCEDNGTPAPTEQPTEPPASPTSEPTNPPATPTDDGRETPVDEGQTGNDSDNGSDAGVDQSQSSPAEKIVSDGTEAVSTELGASQSADDDAGTTVTTFPTTGAGPEGDNSANLMILACWILSIVAAAAAVLIWRKEPRKAYQRW